MARPVHPHSMAPSKPGRTRTAAPQAPTGWYTQPRMLQYLLFDATGIIYLLVRRLDRLRKTRQTVQSDIAMLRHDEQTGPPAAIPR